MPRARLAISAVAPRARDRSAVVADLLACLERQRELLAELDGGSRSPTQARSTVVNDPEMVEVGWAAQLARKSKKTIKRWAKEQGFGWLVGGQTMIHKGRFLEYLLSREPVKP